MTTRKCGENDFIKIANFNDKVIHICLRIQEEKGKKFIDFCKDIENNLEIIELRNDVINFSKVLFFPI